MRLVEGGECEDEEDVRGQGDSYAEEVIEDNAVYLVDGGQVYEAP